MVDPLGSCHPTPIAAIATSTPHVYFSLMYHYLVFPSTFQAGSQLPACCQECFSTLNIYQISSHLLKPIHTSLLLWEHLLLLPELITSSLAVPFILCTLVLQPKQHFIIIMSVHVCLPCWTLSSWQVGAGTYLNVFPSLMLGRLSLTYRPLTNVC